MGFDRASRNLSPYRHSRMDHLDYLGYFDGLETPELNIQRYVERGGGALFRGERFIGERSSVFFASSLSLFLAYIMQYPVHNGIHAKLQPADTSTRSRGVNRRCEQTRVCAVRACVYVPRKLF